MKTYQSSSTVYPQEWDRISCPTLVYHNTGVTEAPAHDDAPTMYHYTVTEYTHAEYITAAAAEIDADNAAYQAALTELGVTI